MTTVAIAHDYLTQRGGAERVVLALAATFPDAPIHTSVWDPAACYPEFEQLDVRTGPLNGVPAFRRDPRLALPLLAPLTSRTTIEADVVVCSSSGWAHGISTPGRRLVYCHAPARWLYDKDAYDLRSGLAGRLASRALGPALRSWDLRHARMADRYLANSSVTARAVERLYGIDAEVVHPPSTLDPKGALSAAEDLEPGFVLCVARPRGYKNVEAAVAAARSTPANPPLVVVGAHVGDLGDGVRATGVVDDATMRWLYTNASVLVATAREDFGLTPVEAAMFGTPTVALRGGGYLDSIVEGVTGLFFDAVEPAAIASAVTEATLRDWDADELRRHAECFSPARFGSAMRRHVSDLT